VICLPPLLLETFPYALFIELLIGLLLGLSGNTLDKSTFTKPNEGIWRSARNSILFGAIVAFMLCSLLLISVLIVVLLTYPQPANMPESDILGKLWISDLLITLPFFCPVIMIIMFITALIVGGLACIQHIILRVFLQLLKSMPWNYPQFLDYAAEHILLRKVGGGYIFLHRLVLEYFAGLENKSDREVSAQSRQETLSPDTTLSAPTALIEEGKHMNVVVAVSTPLPAEGSRLLPCGHEWRPNARFCVVCGTPTPL
jgi:hypothetical protein